MGNNRSLVEPPKSVLAIRDEQLNRKRIDSLCPQLMRQVLNNGGAFVIVSDDETMDYRTTSNVTVITIKNHCTGKERTILARHPAIYC